MNIYLYDGSFEGLLSAVFDAYTRKVFPDILHTEQSLPPLLAADLHTVRTSPEKSGRVHAGLVKKLSHNTLNGLMYAWLSEELGIDTALFRHMRKVFDSPTSMEGKLTDPDVAAVLHAARLTNRELHSMLGFARFQKTAQGVYFAGIAPRHNVLLLMLPHFSERFADQQWILYDTRRNYGIFFENGRFQEVFLDEVAADRDFSRTGRLPEELLAENELLFQKLWQAYFDSTAVRERDNPRLHTRCLPRRYWTHLTEKQR